MKCTILSFAMILTCFQLVAQQDYFIFVQDASRRPFYVRIGEESHSSSAGGHLILSKMRDSVYNLFIGFPKSRYPEQLFRVAVNKKDRGFELKKIDGGWQLFDLQSFQLMRPVAAEEKHQPASKKTDSYSKLMAGVVDDSAVLFSSVQKEEVVQKEEPVAKNEEPLVTSDSVAKEGLEKEGLEKEGQPVKKEDPVAKVEEKKKEVVENKEELLKKSDTIMKGDEGIIVVTKVEDVEKEDDVEKKNDVGKKDDVEKKNDEGKKDETAIKAADTNTPEPATVKSPGTTAVTPAPSYRDRRDIIRFSIENVVEGKLVIYLDRTGPVTDTIRIIIPRL